MPNKTKTKQYSPDSHIIDYVITITRPLYCLLVPISFRCPETRPTLERSTFLRHISGALQRWTSLHPRERSFCGAVCRVALTSFGHVTSAQTVTLFSSVAILLPWEQFLSSSGALPLVQKLRALRRERFSVGRGPGLTTDVQPTPSYK